MQVLAEDVVGQPSRWDLILCGDVCYEAPMTRHILPWLRRMAATTEVWVADPGRAYLPTAGLHPMAATTCRPRWSWKTARCARRGSTG